MNLSTKFSRQPILVTGGAGYIGSHTCKALAKAGFFPISYDNLCLGHEYAVKWGPLIQADLKDRIKLEQTLRYYQPLAVLHFASDALVFESIKNPAKYYSNNIGSTLSLLEAMKECHIPYLIFSSSCATYGSAQFTPIDETHPQNPINPYGRSKWMCEQMMFDFQQAYGLCFVALRYFNAAGADKEGEIGEDHTPETHLIPSLIQTALNIKEKFTVYGTDFPTPDGSAIRDYIHVEDLADAHILALQWLLSEKTSNVFNLGTGKGYSVFEIVNSIQNRFGKEIAIQLERRRKGEPSILTANAEKARKILGWSATKSDLATVISTASAWLEKRHIILC